MSNSELNVKAIYTVINYCIYGGVAINVGEVFIEAIEGRSDLQDIYRCKALILWLVLLFVEGMVINIILCRLIFRGSDMTSMFTTPLALQFSTSRD